MPGSKPGERRGGRQKGTRNKATAARQAAQDQALTAAVALIPPEQIDALSPAEFLDLAWKALAKAGQIPQAISVAKEAAPYFNAKKAPKAEGDESQPERQGYAVIPEQAESVEAWTAASQATLAASQSNVEKSGDPSPDPKPSS